MNDQFDNSALKGKIKEVFGSVTKFAKVFGITRNAMDCKLRGKTRWSRDDIWKAAKFLKISENSEEFKRVFFSAKSC